MLQPETLQLLAASGSPPEPPASEGAIDLLESMIGRAVPSTLRHLWSNHNGYLGNYYSLDGVRPDTRMIADVIRSIEIFSHAWPPLGWIPIGHDDFGNVFVSVPTPKGDIVGFVDLAFDPPTTMLCVVGSSIDRFVYNLLRLDRSDEAESSCPCEIGLSDPDIQAVIPSVSRWLKSDLE
jgi:cell wall assembly regulator SMI1